MDKIQRLNNMVNICNSISKTFCYYLYGKGEITTEDKNRTILALLSTHFLNLKETIIEKHENLNLESLLNDGVLTNLFEDVYKDFSNIKVYKGKEMNEELAVAIIRNKFTHGDFLYDENNGKMIVNLEGTDVFIDIQNLLKFYINIQEELHRFFKGNGYERNLFFNKSGLYIKKVLTTEKEILESLKFFSFKKYKLKKMDNKIIPIEIKYLFDYYIQELKKAVSRGEDIKLLEEYIRKIFEDMGYSMVVETKKIKDKELIEKILSIFMDEKIQNKVEKSELSPSYVYGEMISNITQDDTYMLNKGGVMNLVCLAGMISEKKYNSVECINSFFDLSNEILLGLILARFNISYCYPLDDIYKHGNSYILDREDYLDFSKFNLSEIVPDVMPVNKVGINNAKNTLRTTIKKILDLEKAIINKINQVEKMQSIIEVKVAKKDIIESLKQRVINDQKKLGMLKIKLNEDWQYYNDVKEDYLNNPKYFENLTIIESIRNAIAHGNVEILNSSFVTNFNDLEIRFFDVEDDKICFDMTITLYKFQSLFEDYNMQVISEFIGKVKSKSK